MKATPWAAFRRVLLQVDRNKIRPVMAIRNMLAALIPLLAGAWMNRMDLAFVGSLGALNVSYSDGDDAYGLRAPRMLLATAFVSIGIVVGGLAGHLNSLAVLIAAFWAFGAGMLVALGTTAADIGSISLVTLVIFEARPLSPQTALLSGLVALAGGLLLIAFSLLAWPFRRLEAEQETIAQLFAKLAELAATPPATGAAPLASAEFTMAQEAVAAIRGDHSPETERLNSLLSQAERIRLRFLLLARVRRRLQRDPQGAPAVEIIDRFVEACRQALLAICGAIASNGSIEPAERFVGQAQLAASELQLIDPARGSTFFAALIRDARKIAQSLTGQIRAAIRLTSQVEPVRPPHARGAESGLWRRRIQNQWAIVRANLNFRSVAFRHALRLSICVAVGDAIGRGVDWQRSYWIPMTIAIVLRPDFLTTFSRGILRLLGTFAGLLLSTLIFRALPSGRIVDVSLVAAFTLILRWVGGANYGVFSIAVSGFVVALVAMTGIDPKEVILLRGLNTAIGGALALAAYVVWPTWERTQSGEALARLLDAYRTYLRGVRQVFQHPDNADFEDLERKRHVARIARSNLEASADRLSAEPGATPELISRIAAILASSHDFIYAAMTLEAGALEGEQPRARPELLRFLDDVDLTLYLLSEALRRPHFDLSNRPNLRERHSRMLAAAGDSAPHTLIQIETDRMTNALNTLCELVASWLAAGKNAVSSA